MTLHEWLAIQPIRAHVRRDGAGRVEWVSIPDAADLRQRSAAWRLSDARVTSCAGGSIYMVPHA